MKRSIPNLLILSICNTYTGTKSELPGINKDIEMMEQINNTLNVRVHILKNMEKDELLSTIDKEAKFYEKDVDTIILHYAGHGYHSRSDQVEGFVANDMQNVGLFEILAKFSKYLRLMCVFDGCRSLSSSLSNPNYDEIKNFVSILLYGASEGESCYETSKGGYLTRAFYNAFINQKSMPLKIKSFDLMKLTLMTVNEYNIIIKKRISKIYINKYLRNEFPEVVEQIINVTQQDPKSIALTKINNRVELNKVIDDLKQVLREKIKSKLEQVQSLLLKIKECRLELETMDKKSSSFLAKKSFCQSLIKDAEKLIEKREQLQKRLAELE